LRRLYYLNHFKKPTVWLRCQDRSWPAIRLLPDRLNYLAHYLIHTSMLRNVRAPGAIHLAHNIHNVTLRRPDVEKRRPHAHDVIDLARMNDAYEWFAQNDYVKIRRR
jgi:hypothetical protein